jgi:diacylglycerol kinase (ATP)
VAAGLTVVVNPTSGRGRAARFLPQVRERLRALGGTVEVVISEDTDHAAKLSRQAAEAGSAIVVAMGGDGMVGAVGAGLIGTDAALGIVPTGTGNDFAVALGYRRRRPLDGVDVLADPLVRRIDAGRIRWDGGERPFLNVAGAGFDSEVNETANRMRSRLQGTAKYVAAVMRTLPGFRAGRFVIEGEGERRVLEGMIVAVGNGVSYGGGMKITPGASFTDGMFDVTVIGAMAKPRFVWNFPRVFRGTHVRHPKVHTFRGSRFEISADRPFEVYADGERVGPLPATFEILPQALRVVVPRTG